MSLISIADGLKLIGFSFLLVSCAVQSETSELVESQSNLCLLNNYSPFHQIKLQNSSGIMVDISQILAKKTQTIFNILAVNDEQQAMQWLQDGRCDVTFALLHDTQKQQGLIYSKVISRYPAAMAVLSATNVEIDIAAYKKMTIALKTNRLMNDTYLLSYPSQVKMTSVDTVDIGLIAVSMGVIDGFIDSMPVLIQQLNTAFKPNIKVVELALDPIVLKLVMRSTDSDKMAEFNQVISSLSAEQISVIDKRWFNIDYQLRASISWLSVFIVLPLIVLLILLALRQSKRDKYKIASLMADKEVILQQLAKQKQQANLGLRFVEIISHEYRTPVSVISINTDILALKNKQGQMGLSGQITKIRDAVTRLIAIVETTLDREKLSLESTIATSESFDFYQCLSSVLTELNRLYGNRQVVINCESKAIDFVGDQRLISLMLKNIIENTFKYSSVMDAVEIALQVNDHYLQIMIRDHGIGIPDSDIEHIFEKYHRGSNSSTTSGIGLGLYLTKSIVLQHQGNISVRCPDDGGTEFHISLPKK